MAASVAEPQAHDPDVQLVDPDGSGAGEEREPVVSVSGPGEVELDGEDAGLDERSPTTLPRTPPPPSAPRRRSPLPRKDHARAEHGAS